MLCIFCGMNHPINHIWSVSNLHRVFFSVARTTLPTIYGVSVICTVFSCHEPPYQPYIESPVIQVVSYISTYMDFTLFICAFLCINHCTKLTVVWGRLDFAVIFPCMNHCKRCYVSVELAQAHPNQKLYQQVINNKQVS